MSNATKPEYECITTSQVMSVSFALAFKVGFGIGLGAISSLAAASAFVDFTKYVAGAFQ